MFGIRDFCVKPVALVKLCGNQADPSRVSSLLMLAARRLAKLYLASGLDKETRHTSRLQPLEQYFSELPLTARETVYLAIVKSITCTTIGKAAWNWESSFVAWRLLYSHSSALELCEFIGDGGGKQIFEHIIESEQDYSHIRKVSLGSDAISMEKLSYSFEVTDSDWKPKLETLFSRLNITHLVLRYFCDDDTLSLVGRNCLNLKYLEIHLFPDSVNEQQVTNDGFDELISAQSRRPTLQELNLKECFSHSLSSRTLLSLGRIPSLTRIHVRSFHFCWMKLTLRFNSGAYPPNLSLQRMSINFFHAGQTEFFDDRPRFIDGVPETLFVEGVLQYIPLLFPALESVDLEGIQNDIFTPSKVDVTMLRLIRFLRIRRCPDVLELAKLLPNLASLEIDCHPLSKTEFEAEDSFPNVTVLIINKGSYRHGLDLHDLERIVSKCPRLTDIRLNHVSLQIQRTTSGSLVPASEDEFLDLFKRMPHLRNLTSLSLRFSGESRLTERSVRFLIDYCPALERLENLLTWRLEKDSLDPELMKSKHGFGIKYGSRQHWSLHWRGEDGTLYDPELPVDRF